MTGWRGAKKASARKDTAADRPAPSANALHEAALAYLARGSASAEMVRRVLGRKVARWARLAQRTAKDPELVASDVAKAKEAIEAIVTRLAEVRIVDDAGYAEARARNLSRAGRSRRAIAANLAAKGVDAETARQALPSDDAVELAAALAFARKRRIGPFAREETDRPAQQKALAAMARAGFGWSTCERALKMDREQADERLHENLRR